MKQWMTRIVFGSLFFGVPAFADDTCSPKLAQELKLLQRAQDEVAVLEEFQGDWEAVPRATLKEQIARRERVVAELKANCGAKAATVARSQHRLRGTRLNGKLSGRF
jgi:hypothetical protein